MIYLWWTSAEWWTATALVIMKSIVEKAQTILYHHKSRKRPESSSPSPLLFAPTCVAEAFIAIVRRPLKETLGNVESANWNSRQRQVWVQMAAQRVIYTTWSQKYLPESSKHHSTLIYIHSCETLDLSISCHHPIRETPRTSRYMLQI